MALRGASLLVVLVALAGCAGQPRQPPSFAGEAWQDERFGHSPSAVSETRETLFALEPALLAELAAPAVQAMGGAERLEHLLSLLFSAGRSNFTYAAGHSTGAAETWRSKRGDCLSLTLLTYALAQALGVSAQMQEVRIPVTVDRRGRVDFLSGHVNVAVPDTPALHVAGRHLPAGGIIIDFEPQVGSRQRGKPLSDAGIVSRFYNNRAAEHLAQRDDAAAYAYLKAALLADPEFAGAYTNLAQLYRRHGLAAEAERLLQRALVLNERNAEPLRALHGLLAAQGREAEARRYAELLKRYEDEDPYFWLGTGLAHLEQGRNDRAIEALERAAALASGFEEIHRYLAIAYWREGRQNAANRQLTILSAMNGDAQANELLSRKLAREPPGGSR